MVRLSRCFGTAFLNLFMQQQQQGAIKHGGEGAEGQKRAHWARASWREGRRAVEALAEAEALGAGDEPEKNS